MSSQPRPSPDRDTVVAPPPDDSGRARPWNLAVRSDPAEVVRVESAADVSAAVRLAAERGLRVAVRCTGHGATPIGPDVLLVDTSRMTECVVYPAEGWARVGAGVLWQQVLDLACPHGLAPLCGSSPAIGVVGYLTGGGIGPVSRTFGISSDHVRGFEVVTGDGTVLRASAVENAELFWGLRGGKATLGLVTSVDIDLVPLAEFYGGSLWFDTADASAVLQAWGRVCDQLPLQTSTSAAIVRLPDVGPPPPLAGRQCLSIRFAWVGDPERGHELVEPLYGLAPALFDDISTRPYAQIGRVHGDPVQPAPVTSHTALLSALPPEAIDAWLGAIGDADNHQSIAELRLMGGAISRAPQPSAFCHRDAAVNVFLSGPGGPHADLVDDHAAHILEALEPWTAPGMLVNFADGPAYQDVSSCYDDDTRHRLEELGDQHDPGRVLCTGHVVRNDVESAAAGTGGR